MSVEKMELKERVILMGCRDVLLESAKLLRGFGRERDASMCAKHARLATEALWKDAGLENMDAKKG